MPFSHSNRSIEFRCDMTAISVETELLTFGAYVERQFFMDPSK